MLTAARNTRAQSGMGGHLAGSGQCTGDYRVIERGDRYRESLYVTLRDVLSSHIIILHENIISTFGNT
jgi:hypothetical protein